MRSAGFLVGMQALGFGGGRRPLSQGRTQHTELLARPRHLGLSKRYQCDPVRAIVDSGKPAERRVAIGNWQLAQLTMGMIR